MNWDWEKLQEKRQRQSKNPPQPGDDDNDSLLRDFQVGPSPKPFRFGFPVMPILAGLFILWMASGIFIVHPGEEGVVLWFGSYSRTVKEGPHYRLPAPFEDHILVQTAKVQDVEIGVSEANIKHASQAKILQSSMFTGDENIVHMQFTVQYSINSARKYLFEVEEPVRLIENAAESAMREVVGKNPVEFILTQGRQKIESDVYTILTSLLNSYDIGIQIHAVQLGQVYPPPDVKKAFSDVASAREVKVTIENTAEAYREAIVPPAKGKAESMILAARSYNATIVKTAEGEALRFNLMAAEFVKAKSATQKRLYLETMEAILSSQGVEKVILDKDIKGNIVPMFDFGRTRITTPPVAQTQGVSSPSGSGAESASTGGKK